jgi:exopolysaccharide biosynthesis predicted pyruvyltransferase EpsI
MPMRGRSHQHKNTRTTESPRGGSKHQQEDSRKPHPSPRRRPWLATAASYCCCFFLAVFLICSALLLAAIRLNEVVAGSMIGGSRRMIRRSSPAVDKTASVLALKAHPLGNSNDLSGNKQSNAQQKHAVEDTVISPFTSVPPQAIGLDVANDPRHACLSKMRQRHDEALHPYLLQSPSPDHILLVDPAYHSNVGDHMITLGELQFLQRYVSSLSNDTTLPTLSQCSYIQAGGYVPSCEVEIPRLAALYDRPVAIWHGGGNWGDLWRRAQEPRIASLRNLLGHGYTVLTMPNSWYYQDQRLEQQDVVQIRANVVEGGRGASGTAGRLVFCWREEFSYQQGATLLPFATNVLVPDIAFQLGPYAPIRPPKGQMVDVVLLLRDDHESVVGERSRSGIRSVLNGVPNGQDVTFSIVDWNDRLVRFDSRDFFFTPTAIQLLSMGRVVICDRLHAAILAYLMGVPFIYLDQISGKITKTLASSMSMCDGAGATSRMESANTLTEALRRAVEWLPQLDASELSRAAKREQWQREMQPVG